MCGRCQIGIGLRAISRRSLERKKAHRVGHEYTPLVANEVVQGHLPMGGREGEVGHLIAELESGGRCRTARHALCTYPCSASPHCPRESRRGPGEGSGPERKTGRRATGGERAGGGGLGSASAAAGGLATEAHRRREVRERAERGAGGSVGCPPCLLCSSLEWPSARSSSKCQRTFEKARRRRRSRESEGREGAPRPLSVDRSQGLLAVCKMICRSQSGRVSPVKCALAGLPLTALCGPSKTCAPFIFVHQN